MTQLAPGTRALIRDEEWLIRRVPVWINHPISDSVFAGKQNDGHWKEIFSTGRTPQGMQVLTGPINLIKMIQG